MSKQSSTSSQSAQQSQPIQPQPDKGTVEVSIEAREQEQQNIDEQQEQGVQTPQMSVREQELEKELEILRKQLAQQGPAVKPEKEPAFKVPKGEEGYTHVRVTKRSGVQLEKPVIMPFYPEQYEQISKTPGFEGTVLHKGVEKE